MTNKKDEAQKNGIAKTEYELKGLDKSENTEDNAIPDTSIGSGTESNTHGKLNDLLADLCLEENDLLPKSREYNNHTKCRTSPPGDLVNSNEDNQHFTAPVSVAQLHVHPPTQNSTFSFKHFLNNYCTAGSGKTSNSFEATSSDANVKCTDKITINSLQSSTGARPKVPHSDATVPSISSLVGGIATTGVLDSTIPKMKRSPRFSSFDSQASLAEYASIGTEEGAIGGNESALNGEDSDYFSGAPSTLNINSNDKDRRYVPRSFSSYDMPVLPSSPRRRVVVSAAGSIERRNRLLLQTSTNKLRLDLPIDSASNANLSRPGAHNGSDFLSAAAAAALPDFVQDHWMDPWYAHDMHLVSPPTSPICDIVDNLNASTGCTGNVGGARVPLNINNICNSNATEAPGNAKILPDFLSDGPIIHSSQRLADVAAGLPSNSVGSPDNCTTSTQISRLRMENEQLQRELNEMRSALNEQTKRASDLENQLKERERNELNKSQTESQLISLEEENLNKSKRRTIAGQKHITKLKQQVTQLTTEVETLRRKNEALQEGGAVGGCGNLESDGDDNRPLNTSTFSRRKSNIERPSKTHQLSRDLLRAASNAENNLRQLLAGVDNLRQMAANIEKSETNENYVASPDLFSDFLDECDDYEDYTGGPAL